VLGQPDFTSIGVNGPNRFEGPSDIALDPTSGKVFVADTANNRVLRFTAQAALSNGTAEAVLGQADFTSRIESAVTAKRMYLPSGLTVDTAGRLWVADSGNSRVLRFDGAAGKPSGAAADGVLGQGTFTTGVYTATATGMFFPSDVALDAAGRLWVADKHNNRVLRFDGAASKPNGATADAVLGQPDFTSGSPFKGSHAISSPESLVVDGAGHLWVVDSSNNRVVRFDNAASKQNAVSADGVLGQPDLTTIGQTTSAQGLSYPRGVTLDSAGRLWVADSGNSRVLRFDGAASKPNGATADGVLGQPDFTSKDPGLSAQRMTAPLAVLPDGAGRLWVADSGNNRLLRFDSAAGKPNGAAASGLLGQADLASDSRIGQRALFNPTAVAVDPTSGKLFVADMVNNRVVRFAKRASLTSGAAAEAVLGQPNFTSRGPSTTAQGMAFPMGLTVDPAGRLWVVDRSNNRVLRFDGAASKPSGAAADGVLGQPNFVSSAANNTQGGMWYPTSVAADAAGRLWVVDGYNDHILRFDNAAGKPNGAAADGVLYGGNSSEAQGFARPYGICVDATGRLWVADTNNNRVVWFNNPASKPAAPDGVLGQFDFRSNAQRTSAEGMLGPLGLVADASGRLFVADGGNNRVVWFDNAASKPVGAPADGVWGQPDFTSRTADIGGDSFDLPFALALDPGGQIWLADASNNRVLLFDPARTVAPRAYLPLLVKR